MFTGMVVHGQAIGRTLGFPTANLNIDSTVTTLSDGVYAAIATLHEKKYIGALAIQHAEDRVEVYLVDYIGPEFYGSELTVAPVKMVSQYEICDTLDVLKEKIAKDVQCVIEICKEMSCI